MQKGAPQTEEGQQNSTLRDTWRIAALKWQTCLNWDEKLINSCHRPSTPLLTGFLFTPSRGQLPLAIIAVHFFQSDSISQQRCNQGPNPARLAPSPPVQLQSITVAFVWSLRAGSIPAGRQGLAGLEFGFLSQHTHITVTLFCGKVHLFFWVFLFFFSCSYLARQLCRILFFLLPFLFFFSSFFFFLLLFLCSWGRSK